MGMFSAELGTTEISVQQSMPVAGTVMHFYASVQTPPPGIAAWIFTVRKNGADTAVSCTITGAQLSCSDNVNTASFAAGDLISVRVLSLNNPPNSPGQWTAAYGPP